MASFDNYGYCLTCGRHKGQHERDSMWEEWDCPKIIPQPDDRSPEDLIKQALPMSEGSQLQKIFIKIVPKEYWNKAMMIVTNASRPKNVSDATPCANCTVCNTPVWISPSSLPILPSAAPVCFDCLAKNGLDLFPST